MKSKFRVLFKVEMLHEYFVNHQCRDFDIIPTRDTLALFKKARLLCRHTEDKLIVLIELNEDGEPFFNTASLKNFRSDFSQSVFRFYLRVKNASFFNYTNIYLDFGQQKKLYFANTAQNETSGYLFLSSPVSVFSANREYLPGNLVSHSVSAQVFESLTKYTSEEETDLGNDKLWAPRNMLSRNADIGDFVSGRFYHEGDLVRQTGTDNLFEAAQKCTSGPPDELKDPALWIPRGQGQLQYVNENDVIEYSTGRYEFVFTKPVKTARIELFRFNYDSASPAFDVPVKEAETKDLVSPARTLSLDLSGLGPGKYLVKVNEDSRFVYVDPEMNAGNMAGVLEIFNFLPGTNDYAFLTDNETINVVSYQILFPARSVLWKYVRKDGRARAITDSGTTGYQFALHGNSFISTLPIPLSETALKTLSLEFGTTDFKLSPLPNPLAERFSTCKQNDFEYLCTELNLNY